MSLFALFAFCLFTMYTLVPVLLDFSSATFLNLSLLTSDVYALVAGMLLFSFKVSNVVVRCCLPCAAHVLASPQISFSLGNVTVQPSPLFIFSFAAIVGGIILYNYKPPRSERFDEQRAPTPRVPDSPCAGVPHRADSVNSSSGFPRAERLSSERSLSEASGRSSESDALSVHGNVLDTV